MKSVIKCPFPAIIFLTVITSMRQKGLFIKFSLPSQP